VSCVRRTHQKNHSICTLNILLQDLSETLKHLPLASNTQEF